jgi:hypothetical protein
MAAWFVRSCSLRKASSGKSGFREGRNGDILRLEKEFSMKTSTVAEAAAILTGGRIVDLSKKVLTGFPAALGSREAFPLRTVTIEPAG